MWFLGPVANAVGIVVGTLLGLLLRRFIPERAARASELGLGICTLVLGVKMAMQFENVVILVLSVSVGGALGAALDIEQCLEKGAKRLQARFLARAGDRLAFAFVMTSILYCTGAMAIVGSIQSGIAHNHEVLFAKTMLDGMISITFAAVYGVGVALSAIPVLIYQGGIALLAQQLTFLSEPGMLKEISGVGGVLLILIGLSVARIQKIAVGNFLPALLICVILKAFWP